MRGLGLGLGMRLRRGTAPPAVAPVNTVAPVLSGVAYMGSSVATTDGTWTGSPAPTFAYQWQRFTGGVWTNIGGATAASYNITIADEGVPLRCVVTATNAGGSASANSNTLELWVPTDGGTVAGWWDAQDSGTITIATGVSQWTSKGSRSNGTLTNATGSQQPSYVSNGLNSRPILRFVSASSQRLRNTTSDSWGSSLSQAAVGVVATATSGGTRSLFTLGNTNVRLGITRNSSTQYASSCRRLDSDSLATVSDGSIVSGAAYLATAEWDWVGGTNGQARYCQNGAANAFTAVSWASPLGTTDATNTSSRQIGCSPTTGEHWEGDVGEVVYYEQALSSTNQDKLEGYLAWRWGLQANLPGGHPFKSVPPTP